MDMKLTIQHGTTIFQPPVEEGVKIEWDRSGTPGKLTFKTVNIVKDGISFTEGDRVCFYYDDKCVFVGYIFKKKSDRDKHIEVTCYDQVRYLKNKYSYVFENKSATKIIKALCDDFNLNTGTMENTNYIIPSIAEENTAAIDIIMDVLEETLLNTGNLFVFYDDAGTLKLTDSSKMVSRTLIMETTAENYDYSSSIDDETYNQVVLYYKDEDGGTVKVYHASDEDTIRQWGILRYFEEVKTQTSAQNKANSLLNLYNRKKRELQIKGAFGDISVRGGTLIPIQLDLGDVKVNNYMVVDKVTHTFNYDQYTMDLTVEGAWE